jgi:hypothetical protein
MTTFTITICTNEEHLLLGLPCWTGMKHAREETIQRGVSIFLQSHPEEEVILEMNNSWNAWNDGHLSRLEVAVLKGYRYDNAVIKSRYDCTPVPKHLQELALKISVGMATVAEQVGSGIGKRRSPK